MDRNGPYFYTASGVRFWPLDPRPNEINIDDIAHGLAMTCRFGAQIGEFYSVAQHCVMVSRYVPMGMELQGLMHDAPEAYLGDVRRPFKYAFPKFQQIEDALWNLIARKFGIDPVLGAAIKEVDDGMMLTERDAYAHPSTLAMPWALRNEHAQAYKLPGLYPWTWREAKAHFLNRFHELTGSL